MQRSHLSRYTTQALILVFMLFLLSACNNAPPESDLVITNAWARPAEVMEVLDMTGGDDATPMDDAGEGEDHSAMSGAVSAIYMTIANRGGAADRLLIVSGDVEAVYEIHETQVIDDVMQMRHLERGLEIPANSSVSLKPGGYHIMLMDLQRSLVAGEHITVTLTFESDKEITVAAPIRDTPPEE